MSEVLRIKDLSIAFGGLKAVDNLSFSINENEIYGLIGPNGAGKTTVFNCITQFYEPDAGTVEFKNNQDEWISLNSLQAHQVIKNGLVRTFQNVELVPELSVLDNVLIGGHINFETTFVHQFFQTPKARKEEKLQREKAHQILQKVGIDHLAGIYAGALSYGVRKKIELARTLMSDPKFIILDEPAAGLNDKETEDFSQLIKDIRDEYNCTILLIEHDMGLVMGICDRITAINFGKFLATGTPQEIQKNPDVITAYLGQEDDDE
ncbi:MAG TPA: ABC transporter ATP-binding protein [Erysipelothrix sp.]|jgi:branched-chain amino acid transport system ATP-binding protein|nr:ABC transporter ATP-binding protein [Erysipelothrix sp.]